MVRNKSETAIRCLEIALHPGTGDEETLAAVKGYRRTAGDVPLSEMLRDFSAPAPAEPERSVEAERWRAKFVKSRRDYMELRRRLTEERRERVATTHRLSEAESRIRALGEELHSARRPPSPSFRDILAAARDGRSLNIPAPARANGRPAWTA